MTEPRQVPARRATLKDVAALAGVSPSTASLVFSGKGPVAATTAERVRSAAAELGFAGPDPLAASLRQGRAGVIGVSVDAPLRTAFQDPFAVAVLDGISTVVDAHGFGLLLVSAHVPPSQALDAMIFPLCGPVDEDLRDRLVARGTPVVGTGLPEGPGFSQVVMDNRGPMAELVRMLQELGHERIGHLAMDLRRGDESPRLVDAEELLAADYPDTRERAEGFLAVVGSEVPMATVGTTSLENAAVAAGLLLDLDPRPTAIVAQSDLLAGATIRAAESRALRVPDDLSVTGFDGVDLPWLPGSLTTVDQDGQAKGRLMAELAVAMVEGADAEERVQPTRVVSGTTTGPVPDKVAHANRILRRVDAVIQPGPGPDAAAEELYDSETGLPATQSGQGEA